MYKTDKTKIAIWLGILFLIIFLSANFSKNSFSFANQEFFSNFQQDSESLVLGRILHDKSFPENKAKYNLGYAHNNGSIFEALPLIKKNLPNKHFKEYESLYGLQGSFYSFIYNTVNINTVSSLYLVSSVLTALSIVLLGCCFYRSFGFKFALFFLISMALSPWIISISRNLYWSPFTWFMPIIFGFLAYLNAKNSKRNIYLLCFTLSVLIKSLMGYEYLSTILILSASGFLVDLFSDEPKLPKCLALKGVAYLFILGVTGFLIALLAHADLRGETIIDGLNAIWEQDVQRRTYGDPANFDPGYRESLTISPFSVVESYISDWKTPFLFWVSGYWFEWLFIFCFGVIAYAYATNKRKKNLYLGMMIVFAAAPISWFVLAKGHSHIHKHINYTLWYLGLVPCMLYIAVDVGQHIIKDYVTLCSKNRLYLFFSPFVIIGVVILILSKQNEKFELTLENLTENATKIAKINSGIDLYWSEDDMLTLFQKSCDETNEYFFVDIFPTNPTPEIAKNGGFEQIKIDGTSSTPPSPNWVSPYYGGCLYSAKMPNYSLKSLRLGRLDANGSEMWLKNVNLDSLPNINEIVTLTFSDAKQWQNGVLRQAAAIAVKNTFTSRQSLKVGATLKFQHSTNRTVSKIMYFEGYMVIFVNGQPLMPKQDGAPNKIIISASMLSN